MSTKPSLVILAAGMGSRYGALKQVDPVGPHGEVVIDYSIYDALAVGFGKIVFVIRRDIEVPFREVIGSHFEDKADVRYIFQELDMVPDSFTVPATRKKPWGTVHAVLCARPEVDKPFGVINADDFYGRSSFEHLAAFLNQPAPSGSNEYALVGFTLRNTLSDHGAVSRGVCQSSEDLYLQNITEMTRASPDGQGAIQENDDGTRKTLTGDEFVSMNLWGFTPSFFDHAEARFAEFLFNHGQEEKSEIYIPDVIDRLIHEGRARVRILPSTESWFGITYQEDKPHVVESIGKLVAAGRYPSPLWD